MRREATGEGNYVSYGALNISMTAKQDAVDTSLEKKKTQATQR